MIERIEAALARGLRELGQASREAGTLAELLLVDEVQDERLRARMVIDRAQRTFGAAISASTERDPEPAENDVDLTEALDDPF